MVESLEADAAIAENSTQTLCYVFVRRTGMPPKRIVSAMAERLTEACVWAGNKDDQSGMIHVSDLVTHQSITVSQSYEPITKVTRLWRCYNDY
jgi:hypothetical protein